MLPGVPQQQPVRLQVPPQSLAQVKIEPEKSSCSGGPVSAQSPGSSQLPSIDTKPPLAMQSPVGRSPPSAGGPPSQPSSNRSTPTPRPPSVQRQSPALSASSQRSSPAQSQSPGHSVVHNQDDMQLPSVSATFAAAGMHRLGENVPEHSYPHTDKPMSSASAPLSVTGPGFSSVSSIVQAVSTVSFPQLGTSVAAAPAEVSLPPSTHVKTEMNANISAAGSTASTQTPVHSKPDADIPQPGMIPSSQHVGSTAASVPPMSMPSAGMPVTSPMPGHPLHRMPGPHHMPGQPQMPTMPGGPRVQGPPGAPGQGQPRPRTQRQQSYHQPRNSLPSNLPPHLAGMLTNQKPSKPGFQHSPERHMEPMGQPRFPPGYPMGMPPRGFQGQGEGVMHMPPGARHPAMMQHPGMQGMRYPGMRIPGQGHPMGQMHPGQMSPTAHTGMPPMHHPGQTGPGQRMMGPPGMPHGMGPSQTPPELPSPTQRHPSAPPTPGSVPSTPSPTPASYPHGVIPPASAGMPGLVRTPTPPGFPGDAHSLQQFQRMPFDPSGRPGSEERQLPGKMPPGFQFPGMPHEKPMMPEGMVPGPHLDEALRRRSATQANSAGFSGQQIPGHIPSSAGSTHSVPVTSVKQEPAGNDKFFFSKYYCI